MERMYLLAVTSVLYTQLMLGWVQNCAYTWKPRPINALCIRHWLLYGRQCTCASVAPISVTGRARDKDIIISIISISNIIIIIFIFIFIKQPFKGIGARTIFWLGEQKLNNFSVGEAKIGENNRVPTGPEKSWKVMKFDFSFFRTWKVLNLDMGAEKSWKSPDFC